MIGFWESFRNNCYWRSVSFRKLILPSLSFSKLLPENLTPEDSSNSKEMQGFCENLRYSWNFLNLHSFMDFLVKGCWYWPLEYYTIHVIKKSQWNKIQN